MRNNANERKHTLAFLVIASILGVSSLSIAQDGMNGHGMQGMQMQGPMMKSMEPAHTQMMSIKESGNTDRDYAMMMRAHHQGGIAMSQVELDRGKDPEMRRMAQKVIKDQQKEIAKLDKWLSKQSGTARASEEETQFEDKSRHLHPRDAK